MKNECMIVRDLLPLYVEDLVSDETRAFVDEHLADCEDCRKALKQYQTSPKMPQDAGTVPLKSIKKHLKQQRLKSGFLTALLIAAILITGFAWLTVPQYVPYSDDLLTVTENEDGTVIISFDKDKATGYKISNLVPSEDGTEFILFIHAWKTTWDELFSDQEVQNIVMRPGDEFPVSAIYYSPNTHEEAIQIFGDDANYHVTELPRLALVYYLMVAGLAVVVGGVLRLLFRKNSKAKVWIERITLFPAAYILSHILTKGFVTTTYSMERDFVFILLIATLLYAAGLLGMDLYRNKKETETIIEGQ